MLGEILDLYGVILGKFLYVFEFGFNIFFVGLVGRLVLIVKVLFLRLIFFEWKGVFIII